MQPNVIRGRFFHFPPKWTKIIFANIALMKGERRFSLTHAYCPSYRQRIKAENSAKTRKCVTKPLARMAWAMPPFLIELLVYYRRKHLPELDSGLVHSWFDEARRKTFVESIEKGKNIQPPGCVLHMKKILENWECSLQIYSKFQPLFTVIHFVNAPRNEILDCIAYWIQ